MRMLRWMSGVTKLDRIGNERIRGTTKVEDISKKVQESRLKWYGHVLRREEEYEGKRVMVMEVPGENKRDEDQSGSGWITSRITCRRENCQRGRSARPSSMEASHKNHRPHLKVGKDAEEEEDYCITVHHSPVKLQ